MAIQSVHAGHGGRKNGNSWTDPGAVGSGYKEADVARKIAALIAKKTGVRDVTDNTSTTSDGIILNVASKINTCPNGWQISNHLNAFNGSATGVEVLYGSPDSKATAAKVSAAVAKALGIKDRGPKDGSWLGIAKRTGSGKKVLLIEWGFIDNKKDMQALMSKMDAAVDAMLEVFGYKAGYPERKVGDTVTVQSFATNYQTGQVIPNWVKGQKYKIKKVKSVNQSKSKRAYLLSDVNSWFLEQDVK